ncbi:hypothetical protein AAW14_05550 [Streptomyces hygroscopicus]|nr:hypothetical protein [Streptomyces hygroscopicus]
MLLVKDDIEEAVLLADPVRVIDDGRGYAHTAAWATVWAGGDGRALVDRHAHAPEGLGIARDRTVRPPGLEQLFRSAEAAEAAEAAEQSFREDPRPPYGW